MFEVRFVLNKFECCMYVVYVLFLKEIKVYI